MWPGRPPLTLLHRCCSVADTPASVRERVAAHLHAFDLNTQPVPPLPELAPFALPPLQGADIAQHFRALAREQAHPYLSLAE